MKKAFAHIELRFERRDGRVGVRKLTPTYNRTPVGWAAMPNRTISPPTPKNQDVRLLE